MTRAARPGATKTRLQPLLGATGCARLQQELLAHTVRIAAIASLVAATSLLVAVEPPDAVAEVAQLVGADATVFDIDPALWGGSQVLASSAAAVRLAGLDVAFLPMLRDLDTPEDAQALTADAALPPAIHAILTSAFEQSC